MEREYKTSESKRRAIKKYEANNRVKLTINITPAQREQFNEYCKDKGGTATFIKKLLRDHMRAHGVEPLPPIADDDGANIDTVNE